MTQGQAHETDALLYPCPLGLQASVRSANHHGIRSICRQLRQTSGCGELDVAGAGGGGTSIEADHTVILDKQPKRTAAWVCPCRGVVDERVEGNLKMI